VGGREPIRQLVVVTSPSSISPYGLAASQLLRIRKSGIKLVVCVDTIAASGGYMMASVGDQIYAAPLAVIGSSGVVTHVPNFSRFLDKNDFDVFYLHVKVLAGNVALMWHLCLYN
jgi:serine protease SohB